MTANRYIRWPPACNPCDSKAPLNNFGANLTQFTNRKLPNCNHKSAMKKNQKYENGNGIITPRTVTDRTMIMITRINQGTEGATRTIGKLGHLSGRNLMNAMDRFLSTQKK